MKMNMMQSSKFLNEPLPIYDLIDESIISEQSQVQDQS